VDETSQPEGLWTLPGLTAPWITARLDDAVTHTAHSHYDDHIFALFKNKKRTQNGHFLHWRIRIHPLLNEHLTFRYAWYLHGTFDDGAASFDYRICMEGRPETAFFSVYYGTLK
jgi:hypothetical protein